MRKIVFSVLMLLSFSVFAQSMPDKLKLTIGDKVWQWTFSFIEYKDVRITEICPVSDDVCKIVLDGGKFVDYVKRNNYVIYMASWNNFNTLYYLVKDIDYNVIYLEKVPKPE